jgi:hypothetical protein
MGTPFFATSLKVNVTADLGFNIESSTTAYSSTEMETCITTTKNISTGSGDVIVGSEQGGDVYMGGAMNFLYGITDELLYDSNTCQFYLDKGLFRVPGRVCYHLYLFGVPDSEFGDSIVTTDWR